MIPADRPLRFIDTHCHLNHVQFRDDIESAVERARAANVDRMVVVGYDIASSEAAVELARTIPGVFAAVGVHPQDSIDYDSASEERIARLAADPRVVAIGEIGLDYHYDFSSPEEQRTAFLSQLELASRAGLPIILHCREAYDDLLNLLESEKPNGVGAVMHCWAGTVEEANRAVSLGCWLGFGGILTFKNAEAIREAARIVPMDRLLLETDAPYLAPVPYRSKRNEPANLRIVAEWLAEIRSASLSEIAEQTTANAMRAFSRLGNV